MIGQITDSLPYQGDSYAIAAISENQKLFDPEGYRLYADSILLFDIVWFKTYKNQ